MRTILGGFRSQAISHDGGITWTEPAQNQDLLEPVCQGSIIRFSWPEEKSQGRLLFSNPTDEKRRRNMTVHSSVDDGKTWKPFKTIFPQWSAYSCLTVLSGQEAGILFENGDEHSIERISFSRFQVNEPIARIQE
ncbi:MAG: hypothetical protein ACK4UN_03190 [Limisphaerales bacterium]